MGLRYDLSHLDEYKFTVSDSDGYERHILVTFSDHFFTRKPDGIYDPELLFPEATRNPGLFCVERYRHSLNIREHIHYAASGHVWLADGDNYAVVPALNENGKKISYAIIFSLDKISGLPVDLHMRIKSAHIRDERDISTFGDTRFVHLVTLRMQGKRPKTNFSRGRKKPH